MSNLPDFPTFTAPGTQAKITDIYKDFTEEALGQFVHYLTIHPPTIPISQIPGFAQFTVTLAARIAADESTSSTSYADLTTVGPTLTGLADGKYVFWFGASISNTSLGTDSYVSLKFNSTEAADADAVRFNGTTRTPVMIVTAHDLLNGGNNTVTMRYRVAGSSGFFRDRWIAALRYANP